MLFGRGRVPPWLCFLACCMVSLGTMASSFWILASNSWLQVGRQPWVIYGLLRTKDAVTPSLTTTDVTISLAGYVLVYAVIYGFGIYYLFGLLRDGPGPARQPATATAKGPLALAGERATGDVA